MRIVILGAGYAGVVCAMRLARKSPRASITLINERDEFVERIRLHEQLAGKAPARRKLAQLIRNPRIALWTGRVTQIDRAARTVSVDGRSLAYDRLVLAMGSRPALAHVPGVQEHTYAIDALSMERLARAVPALATQRGRVVIVGGGLTGLEVASELAESHPALQVSLISRGPLGQGLSARARQHLHATCERLRIVVQEGVQVNAVEAGRLVTDGQDVPFDACVWAGGFEAAPLGRAAGLDVNELGQVLVDGLLRAVSDEAIRVIGDMAAPVTWVGDALPMGCKSALPTGAHVADNLARAIAGEPELPFSYATPFYCVSLGRRDGLIQVPRADGSPTGPVITGRRAALFKELVCRGTIWSLALERTIGLSYRAMRDREHARRPHGPANKALPA